MLRRLALWLQFRLEQFLIRGSHYRLLLICMGIGALSVLAGFSLYFLDGPAAGSLGDSVWWAFLRLTDPGYLGDDEGTLRRTVSTVLTIAGYVLFMGAMVATMTQGLNDQMRRLERGLTPVIMRNHIVVIGFNASTAELMLELTQSQRNVMRFLSRHHTSTLRIAILTEEVTPELDQILTRNLGSNYNRALTVLRSGSALQPAHLERVAASEAAVVVFSPPEHQRESYEASDDAHLAKAVTTLACTLAQHSNPPIVVASVSDPLKLEVIRRAYPAHRSELVAGSKVLAQLIVRFMRHPGLNRFWEEVLSQQLGSEIYVHQSHGLAGAGLQELVDRFEDAIVLGKLDGDSSTARLELVTTAGFRLTERDGLVVLGHNHELTLRDVDAPLLRPAATRPVLGAEAPRRVLLIGWNARTPWLLRALDNTRAAPWRVTVGSITSVGERNAHLAQAETQVLRLELSHLLIEPTSVSELRTIAFDDFDTVLIVGSDKLESAEDVDARTLLIYQLVAHEVAERRCAPRLLVELRDPQNADLFEGSATEILATSDLITHLLAQLTLRPERRPIFDALLAEGGPEVELLAAASMGLHGPKSFGEICAAGAAAGLVVLGVQDSPRAGAAHLELNPSKDAVFPLSSASQLVVLADSRPDAEESAAQG